MKRNLSNNSLESQQKKQATSTSSIIEILDDSSSVSDFSSASFLHDMPFFTCHHASYMLGQELIVAGGVDQSGIFQRCVFSYNVEQRRWKRMTDMNHQRQAFSLQFVSNKLFAVGGVIADSSDMSHDRGDRTIEMYDSLTFDWLPVLSTMTESRICAAYVPHEGERIYAVGGRETGRGEGVSKVEVFDCTRFKWSSVERPPLLQNDDIPQDENAIALRIETFRLNSAMLSCRVGADVGGDKYFFCGKQLGAGYRVSSMLDPSKVSEVQSMLIPCNGSCICVVGTKIYFFGGEKRDFDCAEGRVLLSYVQAYDTSSDSWTRYTNLPFGNSGMSCAFNDYNRCVYITGGKQMSDKFVVYDVDADKFVCKV